MDHDKFSATEAAAVAALAATSRIETIDGAPVLITPDGSVMSLAHYLGLPPRPRGTHHVETQESFLRIIGRLQGYDVIVWVKRDLDSGRLIATAVLNEHPGWRDWRVIYTATTTPAWDAWTAKNGRSLTQHDLAEFLETRLADIVQPAGSNCPSGADVLTFVSKLEDTRKVKYGSAVNLQNGMVQLEFIEEGDDATRGKLDVFREFAIGVAPYLGGQPYEIRVALRYKIDRNSGQITFRLELRNIERVVESASQDIIDAISAAGYLTVLGSPD